MARSDQKRDFDPSDAVNAANSFSSACGQLITLTNRIHQKRRLNGEMLGHAYEFGPVYLLESIAIEIYLKALLKHFRGVTPRCHDALALFKQLPPEVKLDLEFDYAQYIIDIRGTGEKFSDFDTLPGALKPFRTSMDLWRYPYEGNVFDRTGGKHQSGYVSGRLRIYCDNLFVSDREQKNLYDEIGSGEWFLEYRPHGRASPKRIIQKFQEWFRSVFCAA